jgi:hypothetical protein
MFVMTPSVTTLVGGFSPRNLVPYFQPPKWNPPLGFGNFRSGILSASSASLLHGGGGPLGGGKGHSVGGGGPPGRSKPPSGSGPISGEGPSRGGGGKFPIGGTCVPFNVP